MGICHFGPKGGTAVHGIPESALASLEVVGQKSSKGQGGSGACHISLFLFGGSWTLLGLILPRFFAFVFNFDFLSIFFRFWRGFESVLGGQNGRKIEIFVIFLDMPAETLFLIDFCLIFGKIDDEKPVDCSRFFCVMSCVFPIARNLKMRAPA